MVWGVGVGRRSRERPGRAPDRARLRGRPGPPARKGTAVAPEEDRLGHALVVSPHLDDAVLSASHRIRPGAATVVTVFAGTPAASIGLTGWDAFTGATDSAARMLERYGEDDEAMRRLGGVPA